MKKTLLALALLLLPATAFATPVSLDFSGGNLLQPLQSAWGALFKASYFQASSTTAINRFPNALFTNASSTNATSTNFDIVSLLTFGGVTGNSWDDFCTTITGSAALCDGNDATGGGGASFDYPFPGNATSTNIMFNGGLTGALTGNADTATKLLTARAINGVNFDGSAAITITAASSTLLANNNTFSGNNTFSNTITGSITGNAGTVTNGVYTTTFNTLFDNRLSASSSISGITTLPNLSLPYSQLTGTPTLFSYPFPSNATTTSIAFNGGLTGTLTGSLVGNSSTATALAADPSDCSAGSFPLGINAAGTAQNCTDAWTEAENTAAAYAPQSRALTVAGTANQITSSAGSQTLAADRTWTLSIPSQFNIQNASTTNFSANTLAVGGTATTSISSAGALKIQSLSGVLIGTAGAVSAGVDGTDYTLVNAVSCTNQVVTALTAAGVGTCSSVSNAMLTSSSVTVNGTSIALGASGTITAASSTLLANNNTFTGLNRFSNASSTLLSVFNNAYFGATATSTFTSTGFLGIGTTSPFAALTLDRTNGFSSSTIVVYEYRPATTTAATLDCRTSTQHKWRLGGVATTLTLTGMVPGQTCRVVVENPNGTAGALTWAVASGYQLYWSGGSTPSQTTTANKTDVWSFIATMASSSNVVILGAQTANF